MRTVIDYKIVLVTDSDTKEAEKINYLLSQGWQPYGSPFMGIQNIFTQAMVKYKQEPNEETQTKAEKVARLENEIKILKGGF